MFKNTKPIYTHDDKPFCWQGIPFATSALVSSLSTLSGFCCEVVETLQRAFPVTTAGPQVTPPFEKPSDEP